MSDRHPDRSTRTSAGAQMTDTIADERRGG